MTTVIHLDCGTKLRVKQDAEIVVEELKEYDHDKHVYKWFTDLSGRDVAVQTSGVNAVERDV